MNFKTWVIVDALRDAAIWIAFLVFVVVMYHLTGHSSWAWWLIVPTVGFSDAVSLNLNWDNTKDKKDNKDSEDSTETEDKKDE